METPLLSLLGRANLNQWTSAKVSFSKGATSVGVSLCSREDGDKSNFQNVLFSSYMDFRAMGKVKSLSDSEGHALVDVHRLSMRSLILRPRLSKDFPLKFFR
jgi:hypothetical protein